MGRTGIVAIGRNEGDRLRQCLQSLDPITHPIVYVDSGSTDGSPAMAHSMGVEVIDLDLSIPFTAARARNAGFARLLEIAPDIEFVQFVDGDCAVAPAWLSTAEATLRQHPEIGVVSGRRRERYPERSIYNRLCDIEWNTPIGEARYCGGDALMRVEAVKQVGGYNAEMIAGEDYEICIRIRQQGWKVMRMDAEMTIHDAAITSIRQWWKRAVRCGYAYALGAAMYGAPPEKHFVRELRRVWIYGCVLPFLLLSLAWPTTGWSLLGFLIYPLQILRIARGTRRTGVATRDALAYGVSCMLGKLPEFLGVCRYHRSAWRNRPSHIIEYK